VKYYIIKVHAPVLVFLIKKTSYLFANFDALQICRYNYSTSSINRMYYIRNRIGRTQCIALPYHFFVVLL